jgi:hypothetical protein
MEGIKTEGEDMGRVKAVDLEFQGVERDSAVSVGGSLQA